MGRAWIFPALLLALLTACGGPGPAPQPEETGAPETEAAAPAQPEEALSEGLVSFPEDSLTYPLVPDTTAETYGLEGRDAAMFLGAMSQFEGFEKPSEDLWLPNVAVLGEYEEDGDQVVLAWVQVWQLYGYQGPETPMTAGGGGNYAVMRLREQKEGVWECREAVHNYFADPTEFFLENCGEARRELVEAVLAEDSESPPAGSAWFNSMEEALAAYEAHTGMDILWTSTP